MSKSLTTEHLSRSPEENQAANDEENGVSSEVGGVGVGTSLFDLLSPDLLLLVFQWVGPHDMKSYIRLAISCDQYIAHFIYTECAFLWKVVDLAKLPGITDSQLQSLLERVDARNVTRSILLDKTTRSPIAGSGLEPLRHSRVLESVDLRQTSTLEVGETGLDDELVADILSTMLPHKLETVKVRKQFESNGIPMDQYCFSWSSFLTNLKLFKARKCAKESCSHCAESLAPEGRVATQKALIGTPVQCTVCSQYSCRPWNPNSDCPRILECRKCLEWCCPCRQVMTCDFCNEGSCSECEQAQLTCPHCGESSCSECKEVRQCKTCRDSSCEGCRNDLFICDRCDDTYCDGCMWTRMCTICEFMFCGECSDMAYCGNCADDVCKDCQKDESGAPVVAYCKTCDVGLCVLCGPLDDFEECSYCGIYMCRDDPICVAKHVCTPPGELVYKSRNAMEGDDKNSLCACGKKHLESSKGQQFMCVWLQK